MAGSVPHEFAIGGVLLPPILIAVVLGLFATIATVRMLNRYRLSRHLSYPQLAFVAIVAIYTVLIGTFLVRI